MSTTTAPRAWPLVGRIGELRLLQGILAGPDAKGIVIGGPTGVGKTRLALECLDRAEEAGMPTMRVSATRASAELPFGAVAPLLSPESWPEASDAPLDQAGLLRRFATAIGEKAGGRRLALMVDDAHLLDDASAILIYQFVSEGKALLLATLQSGVRAPDPVVALWKDGHVNRLDLDGLDGESLNELLTDVLGGPVDPATVVRFAARSQGNVLYLRELVLGGLESGALAENSGLWRLVGPLAPSGRLVELVESRLGDLDEAERELLEIVALGEPLTLAELTAVADVAVAETLERNGLLASGDEGGGVRFRLAHPIHGEVLRQQMSGLRRQRMAAALAAYVEGAKANKPEDQLRMATWRLQAGNADPELLLAAATAARERRETGLAADLVEAAIRGGAGFEAELLAAELDGAEGRGEEADAGFARLVEQADDDNQRAVAIVRRIDNLRQMGRFEDALALTDGAKLSQADPTWWDEIASRRASLLLDTAGPAVAVDAALVVRASASGLALVWSCVVAAAALGRTGRLQEAVEAAQAGQEASATLVDASPLWPLEVVALGRAGALTQLGALHEAEALCRAEHARAVATGAVDAQAFAAWQLGRVFLAQGRVESAAHHAREAAALFRQLRRWPVLRDCLMTMAQAAALRNQPGAAAATLAELDALETGASLWTGIDLSVVRAWTSVAEGDLATARAHLEEAGTLGERIGDAVGTATALHDLARIGFARDVVDRLSDLSGGIEGGLAAARVAHTASLAAQDPGGLEAASEDFEGLGALLLAAEAAADAAVAWTRDGEPRKASGAQRRAAALIERCEGAVTPALGSVTTRSVLTPAERQVALLAAAGESNRDIADALVLSLRTVENRLHRIYEKLGIAGRSELKSALEG